MSQVICCIHCQARRAEAMTLQETALETAKDTDLQSVIQNIKSGTWTNRYGANSTVDTFLRCKNELTVFTHENGDLLLHETRLVIPKTLQRKVISIAHEGNQGIVRTKQILRSRKGVFSKHRQTG